MDERIDIPVHGQRKRLAQISKQPMRERQYVPNRAWESSQVTIPLYVPSNTDSYSTRSPVAYYVFQHRY